MSFVIISFIFGSIIGSFLNVLIYRLPHKMSVAYPSSHCPLCKHRLRLPDLFPLLSYIVFRGGCRHCGGRISLRYPAVELLCALGFLLLAYRLGPGWHFMAMALLYSGLLACSFIDLDYKIIPDKILLFLSLAGLPLILVQHHTGAVRYIAGALLGGLLLLLPALVSRGGMGGGDIKLAGVIGLYLGWQKILLVLFSASVLAALSGAAWVLVKKKSFRESMPFGPFLAAGAMAAILWGDTLIKWYMDMYWQ